MVCDAEIYYSTVFYKKNMVESDTQRRSESFAAFSVSGINKKLLLNTKFFLTNKNILRIMVEIKYRI